MQWVWSEYVPVMPQMEHISREVQANAQWPANHGSLYFDALQKLAKNSAALLHYLVELFYTVAWLVWARVDWGAWAQAWVLQAIPFLLELLCHSCCVVLFAWRWCGCRPVCGLQAMTNFLQTSSCRDMATPVMTSQRTLRTSWPQAYEVILLAAKPYLDSSCGFARIPLDWVARGLPICIYYCICVVVWKLS